MTSSTRACWSAVGALVVIAVIWGVAFSLVKETLDAVNPASLVTWRFAVATVVLLVARPRCVVDVPVRTLLRGSVLGCILGAGFLVHTRGMQSTSVVSAAFITGTVVVFAPLVARIYPGRKLTGRMSCSVAVATAGLAFISIRGLSTGIGELLITAAALLWAVHLVGLEVWSKASDYYSLAVIQVGVVSVMAAAVQVWTEGAIGVPAQLTSAAALIALGAVATGGAFLLLTWAQTRIDATTAAIVLTLEPVFGAATAISLGEALSLRVMVGAAAVVVATILAARPSEPPASSAASRSAGRSPWWSRQADGPRVARRALPLEQERS